MRRLLSVLVVLLPVMAVADEQASAPPQPPSVTTDAGQQPVLRGEMGELPPQYVQPLPAPSNVIAPAAETQAAPQGQPAPPAQQPAPPGQWVYTQQYGWLWMPYGTPYTYLPPNDGTPDMYVYYPTVGWCWVVAPWVWGWGPVPYWGIYGTVGFGWYGYGYGHWYGYAAPYYGYGWGHGYYYGGRWVGYHPAAPRGGGYVPPVHGGGYSAPHAGGFSAPHGGGSFGGFHGGGGHH